MPAQEVAVPQPPSTENEENNVPSSQPIVGIIYPPPEVRSILCQEFRYARSPFRETVHYLI